MSREDYRQSTDGRPRGASTVGHDCERIRRFTEEDAARTLRSHSQTYARDWAKHHRSTSAAAPMLSDAYGAAAPVLRRHRLRGQTRPLRVTFGGH